MDVKPALVKELRERTGAGMMDCKKALVDANGDLDVAGELLRKQGQAKADKKAGRVAAEGRVALKSDAGRHALRRGQLRDRLRREGRQLPRLRRARRRRRARQAAGRRRGADAPRESDGRTLEEARLDARDEGRREHHVRRFELRREHRHVGTYVHGARIGVLVELEGGTPELARDLAMQVASLAARATFPRTTCRRMCIAKEQRDHHGSDPRKRRSRRKSSPRWSRASFASSSTRSRSTGQVVREGRLRARARRAARRRRR